MNILKALKKSTKVSKVSYSLIFISEPLVRAQALLLKHEKISKIIGGWWGGIAIKLQIKHD